MAENIEQEIIKTIHSIRNKGKRPDKLSIFKFMYKSNNEYDEEIVSSCIEELTSKNILQNKQTTQGHDSYFITNTSSILNTVVIEEEIVEERTVDHVVETESLENCENYDAETFVKSFYDDFMDFKLFITTQVQNLSSDIKSHLETCKNVNKSDKSLGRADDNGKRPKENIDKNVLLEKISGLENINSLIKNELNNKQKTIDKLLNNNNLNPIKVITEGTPKGVKASDKSKVGNLRNKLKDIENKSPINKNVTVKKKKSQKNIVIIGKEFIVIRS